MSGTSVLTSTDINGYLNIGSYPTTLNSTLVVEGASTLTSVTATSLTNSGTSSLMAVTASSLLVTGATTFTSGFACGNQTTPYLQLFGTASVTYAGNALDSYASSSSNTNVVSVCTFDNSVSFPSTITGGYVNTNYQYIWASFVSSYNGSTNQINVSFVNLGQSVDYFPSTISFLCWGF